jgi:hypothetical protein
MKPNATSTITWWLRSPHPTKTPSFSYVDYNGNGGYGDASYNGFGVCPCFAW